MSERGFVLILSAMFTIGVVGQILSSVFGG